MSQTTEKTRAVRTMEPMSYEQFLTADFENPHVEWVDGRIIPMAPITDAHQYINGFLYKLLGTFVEEKKLGVVLQDPFQMKTGPDLPGRAPDLLFVSTNHLSRLKKTYLKGPADLVVEVISPESQGRDRGEKFCEYEKGGVPEYWLIDPQRKQAEFYLRNSRGMYQPVSLDRNSAFHSVALPGVWIKPAWFWKTPMPTMLSVLREWGLL